MAPDAALASVVSAILVIVGHQSIGAGIALRVALPAVAIAMVAGTDTVNNLLNSIPEVITRGLQVAGGFIVVVGYAMVIRSHLRLLPHQRHADSNRDTRGGYDGRQGRLDRTVRGVGDPIFRGTIRPVLAALVAKWTSVNMPPVISEYTNAAGDHVITTLQTIFDSLMPSIVPLLINNPFYSIIDEEIRTAVKNVFSSDGGFIIEVEIPLNREVHDDQDNDR